jgi:PadR family transcriptional regulator
LLTAGGTTGIVAGEGVDGQLPKAARLGRSGGSGRRPTCCLPEFETTVTLLLTLSRRGVFFLLKLRGSRFMTEKPSDLVQGTLDMLILKTLALEPMHGYGIAVRLEQMSKGVFRLNAGSLFVAFQRLQRAGLIRSEWRATENSRRAKYYVLTDQGRKRLNSETREWGKQVAAIARILEAS